LKTGLFLGTLPWPRLKTFSCSKKVFGIKADFKNVHTIKAFYFRHSTPINIISSSQQVFKHLYKQQHQGAMFFCFDDGSGTKKASTATLSSATTILPMFFASTLFVFVLVGQVNSEEEDNVTVGFFNHTLKNDQVTLRDYSAAVEAGDVYNLTKYTSLPGSCDVEIKNGSM